MAALQRAIAFAEMDDVSQTIAENLNLDMARLPQVFLHIEGVVAEIRHRFAPADVERLQRSWGESATFMPLPPPPPPP